MPDAKVYAFSDIVDEQEKDDAPLVAFEEAGTETKSDVGVKLPPFVPLAARPVAHGSRFRPNPIAGKTLCPIKDSPNLVGRALQDLEDSPPSPSPRTTAPIFNQTGSTMSAAQALASPEGLASNGAHNK